MSNHDFDASHRTPGAGSFHSGPVPAAMASSAERALATSLAARS